MIKKFFKKIFKLCVYLFSPLYLIIIIILSPFYKIRLGCLPSHRLGEIAIRTELYLNSRQLPKKNQEKVIDIFTLTNVVANKTHTKLIKKKIFILPDIFGFPLYVVLKFLSKKISFFKKFIIMPTHGAAFTKQTADEYLDHRDLFIKTKGQLDLDASMIQKGNEFLKKLEIDKNAKIICLIVRDSNYLEVHFPESNWEYHNHRNCDISNYEEAVNYAIEKGYYVFHMGQNSKKYLNIKSKNYIQYSKDYRTDFLDIYLAYKCEFCITCSTGWDFVPAYNFRKPLVWTNTIPIGDPIFLPHRFIFSPKIHYDKKRNKYLSLKEIKDLNLSFSYSSINYTDKNITLIENNSRQIKESTKEMIDTLNNEIRYSSDDEEKQKKLLKIYDELFSYKNGNHMSPFSRMSQFYLNQNQFLIEEKPGE